MRNNARHSNARNLDALFPAHRRTGLDQDRFGLGQVADENVARRVQQQAGPAGGGEPIVVAAGRVLVFVLAAARVLAIVDWAAEIPVRYGPGRQRNWFSRMWTDLPVRKREGDQFPGAILRYADVARTVSLQQPAWQVRGARVVAASSGGIVAGRFGRDRKRGGRVDPQQRVRSEIDPVVRRQGDPAFQRRPP